MKRKQYPGFGPNGEGLVRSVECAIRALEPAEGEPKRFEIAVSSEYPVQRFSWLDGEPFREVLSHDPDHVDLTRFTSGGAPVLVDHNTRDQVGVIDSARIDADKVLRAVVRFSESARGQEIQRDVEQGIRKNISIGYQPDPRGWVLVEQSKELGDLWRSVRWAGHEASFVPIPADPTVGVGRSSGPGARPAVTVEVVAMRKRVFDSESGQVIEVDGSDTRAALNDHQVAVLEGRGTVLAPEAPAPKPGTVRDRGAEQLEIIALVEENQRLGHDVKVNREWLQEGLTPDQYARRMLTEITTKGKAQKGSDDVSGQYTERELAGYSLGNAIQIAAGMKGQRDGFGRKGDGIEWEIHQGLAKNIPVDFQRQGGVLMPIQLIPGKRTMSSTQATKGSELVFDRPGELIEYWRNASVCVRAGARVLPGLVGPIAFPRKMGGMTFYWVAETPGTGVQGSDVALGFSLLRPKTLMGKCEYSRQLVQQAPSAGVDVENLLREDAGEGMALTFDLAGIHGTGIGGEPLGLFNSPDVLAVTGMAATRAKTVEFASKLAAANAPTNGAEWLMTPELAGKFMSTPEHDTAAPSKWLWEGTIDEGVVAGYKSRQSNQVKKVLGGSANEHGVALGAWREMIMGGWGVVEILADPYTAGDQALVRVYFYQLADVMLRHPQAFCTSSMVP